MIDKILNIPTIIWLKFGSYYYRWLFRKKGIEYGSNLSVLGKIYVVGSGKISIGDNFLITSGFGINAVSSNILGAFHVEANASLNIGDNVGMNSTRIRVRNNVTIGDNVKIGAGALLIDTDSHPLNYLIRRSSNDCTKSSPIIIGDDVWIGAQSIILKGVTIGARSIIGAGSVVTKSIPADCIAAGNPCKVVKKLY